METTIKVEKTVNVKILKVDLPVRYDDEDMPYDFPLRKGDMWSAIIDIDRGVVLNWPEGEKGSFHMKVCDEGSYFLLDEEGNTVLKIEEDYVPNKLLPPSDGYGNYVELHIGDNGVISNWYSQPSLENFMLEED